MEQLYTRWGRSLDPEHVLPEYPRPLLQRQSYINLNGYWEYAVTGKFRRPRSFDGRILVPFSPESILSGVGRQLQPDEYLWYRTMLSLQADKLQAGFRLLLHFGAVDQACRVYINGREVTRHTGGYLPFSADITEYCRKPLHTLPNNSVGSREPDGSKHCPVAVPSSKNSSPEHTVCPELLLAVRDLSDTSYHARGKQKLRRGGMFYTAQSGIWQTVWMEYVPEHYVEEVLTAPDLKHRTVQITVRSSTDLPVTVQVKRPALYQDEKETTINAQKAAQEIIAGADGRANQAITLSLPVIRPWTCDTPYLYYVTVTMGEDTVESYFALRDFTLIPDQNGIPRICLNGQEQFQNGVLDQGYWPDGLYTAPADAAYIFDITEMKKMGFTMLRKHIKIEPQRWYYHCDRLGMIVWQDMVNGGSSYKHWFVTYAATLFSRKKLWIPDNCLQLLSRVHREGRMEFIREMKATIRLLKGHPSIAMWVLFNEGWGQFHAGRITQIARKCDPSRLIDQASGWFDQNGGDLQSIHHYFFQMKFAPESRRATVLSEFGGYSMRVPGHSACDRLYGYGIFKDTAGLRKAFRERMRKVQEQIPQGMCASVYTQLSDVEEEVNGIFTYDREINKIAQS